MSDPQPHLAMYLAGPMQAWGHASRYTRRTTLAYPTRSGLIGLLMAALGAPRDDAETLQTLNALRLEVLAFRDEDQPLHRWTDYHTVGGGYDKKSQRQSIPRRANNSVPETVLTRREYLADARFGALAAGEPELLHRCHEALLDPKWGLWLGRKACIPTDLIAQGIHDSRDAAAAHLEQTAGRPVARSVREVETFEEGTDSLMDVPLDLTDRRFSLRRVHEGPPPTA